MKKLLVTTILSLISLESQALTLEESLIASYNNNPVLASKREELKTIDEEIWKGLSQFLPSLTFQMSKQNSKNDRVSYSGGTVSDKLTPLGKQTNNSNNLQLKQNLFNGGESVILLKTAKYTIEAARADLINQEQETLLNTVKLYSNILYSLRLIEIAKENIASLENSYNATKERFDAGIGTLSDVATAEANLEESKTALTDANGNYLSAVSQFVSTTSVEPKDLEKILPTTDLPGNLDELIISSKKFHPSIIKAKYIQNKAEMNVLYSAAQMLPSLDLQASINKSQSKTNSSPNASITTQKQSIKYPASHSKQVTLSLTVPIYQAGIEYSNIRKNRASFSEAKLDYRATLTSLESNSTQAWINHQTRLSSLTSTAKSQSAYKIALDGVTNEYKEGTKSITDLVSTQRNYFSQQRQHAKAAFDAIVSSYEVKKAEGKLTAKDLALKTKLYDPTENYNKIKFKIIGL